MNWRSLVIRALQWAGPKLFAAIIAKLAPKPPVPPPAA